jgi:hypothetical protein
MSPEMFKFSMFREVGHFIVTTKVTKSTKQEQAWKFVWSAFPSFFLGFPSFFENDPKTNDGPIGCHSEA